MNKNKIIMMVCGIGLLITLFPATSAVLNFISHKQRMYEIYGPPKTPEEVYQTAEPTVWHLDEMKKSAFEGYPETVVLFFNAYLKSSAKAVADYDYLRDCLSTALHRQQVRKNIEALGKTFYDDLGGTIAVRYDPKTSCLVYEPENETGLSVLMALPDDQLGQQILMIKQLAVDVPTHLPPGIVGADKALTLYYMNQPTTKNVWDDFPANTKEVVQNHLEEIDQIVGCLEKE